MVTAKKYSRAASTRVENILMDNGVEELDQSEAEELKDVWKRLEDPGFFITAESFVENAEKYAVDGVIRVYLHAELTKGWGKSYSATAIADIRFVDNEANTLAYSSIPMGVPGKPPSDGLTKSSAVVNAIQRAVDEGGEKLGLEVIDVANPRTLKFKLTEVDKPVGNLESIRLINRESSFDRYIGKSTRKTVSEKFTCHDIDPSGVLGVAGGYVKSTGFGSRTYASQLHVIDLRDNKEILLFATSLKERKHSWEKGVRKLQDCMFIENWRYLLGLTGNHVSLWDTERGIKMSEIHLKRGIKSGGALDYLSDGLEHYVQIKRNGKHLKYFAVTR